MLSSSTAEFSLLTMMEDSDSWQIAENRSVSKAGTSPRGAEVIKPSITQGGLSQEVNFDVSCAQAR